MGGGASEEGTLGHWRARLGRSVEGVLSLSRLLLGGSELESSRWATIRYPAAISAAKGSNIGYD